MMMSRVDAVREGVAATVTRGLGDMPPLPVYDWVLRLSKSVKCERVLL
jgi:hypothetical protein